MIVAIKHTIDANHNIRAIALPINDGRTHWSKLNSRDNTGIATKTRNRGVFPAILNSTQTFRIGIRDSRHFLPAFLKTFRIHTIIHTVNANHKIHQKAHREFDDE